MKRTMTARLTIALVVTTFVAFVLLAIVLSQFFYIVARDVPAAVQRYYWIFLFTVLTVVFLITSAIVAKIVHESMRAVEHITQTAKQVAAGNYLMRTATQDSGAKELAEAVDQLATNLQEVTIFREMDKERIKTLVESIGSSLLMFGRGGKLNMINGVYEETFSVKRETMLGKSFSSLNLPEPIERAIEDVFLTERVCEKQLTVETIQGTRHLSLYGAPVIGMHGNWLGIIIVLHDITNLVKLEEVRKEFVANVSHELRTPVTSIKGFTETIIDGAIDDRDVTFQFLEIIRKESDRLQLLIDDLLELSRIEQTKFTLDWSYVPLERVIADAAAVVQTAAREKSIELTFDVSPSIVIEADEHRLVQVFVNLLSNAVTYSRPETSVHVTAQIEDGLVVIRVSDEGVGIAEEDVPRLFERFYRVDKDRARDSGGTGLGLAIVKHLMEAHNGTIDVTSELDVGTTFTLRLPPRASTKNGI